MKKTKYHTLGSIFIASPFLRTAILKLDSRDPNNLIYAARKATDVFEAGEAQANIFSLKNNAFDHVKEFSAWLHGIILNQVPDLKYEVAPNDGELRGYVKERQEKCVLLSLEAMA